MSERGRRATALRKSRRPAPKMAAPSHPESDQLAVIIGRASHAVRPIISRHLYGVHCACDGSTYVHCEPAMEELSSLNGTCQLVM